MFAQPSQEISRTDIATGHALGRRHVLLAAAFASLIPLIALVLGLCRGPTYLEVNIDPEYAYLVNALLVAEGHSPVHTDHPGTPVQVVGAIAIRILHVVAGHGTLRDDLLLHPERFMLAFRISLAGVTTMLSFLGGCLALRATGRAAHAAAIQCSPLLVRSAAILLDRPIPEPLMMGLAILMSGWVLLVLSRRDARLPARHAIGLGVIAGVGVATKFLCAPLFIIPVFALKTWRHRVIYGATTLAAFVVAVLPMASRFGRTWDWVKGLASHTGRHGQGRSGVMDLSAFPRQLRMLISHEPGYLIVAVCALFAVGIALACRKKLPPVKPVRRTLFAVAVAQIALLLLVAKHPADYYLAAGGAVGGLALCLISMLIGSIGTSAARRTASLAAIVPTIAIAGASIPAIATFRSQWSGFKRIERPTVAFVHAPENRAALQGARISTPESALHFGNYFAGGRYTADLERLYPGVKFWDWTGLSAFGRPLTEAETDSLWASGELRATVSVWFDAQSVPPGGLAFTTLQSLGRERLIRATRTGSPTPSEFTGFIAVQGLGSEEGPYPAFDLPFRVRWGTWPETVLRVRSEGGPMLAAFECRTNNLDGQAMEVMVNGTSVLKHAFQSRQFETLRFNFQTAPGDNEVRIRYANAERGPERALCVLFRKLSFAPAGTP